MFGEGCYLHTAVVLTYSTDKLRKWMFICIGWGQFTCTCLQLYLSVYLYLSTDLPFCLLVFLSVYPSTCLPVYRYSISHHSGLGFREALL